MWSPLKVASRNVWPSAKSRAQPTFGHTATAADGAPQYFVITACWDISRSLTSKPSFVNACLGDLGDAGGRCRRTGPTISIGSPLVAAGRRSPPSSGTPPPAPDRHAGDGEVVGAGARPTPPACSNPGTPGGRKCVATVPTRLPPSASSTASRSKPASDRLADVEVVERRDGRVQRRPAAAAGVDQLQLRRVLRHRLLEHRRRQHEVAREHVRALPGPCARPARHRRCPAASRSGPGRPGDSRSSRPSSGCGPGRSSCPARSVPTMYGPVATWWVPYSETFSRSKGSAYSRGTGAASGSTSAAASVPPVEPAQAGRRRCACPASRSPEIVRARRGAGPRALDVAEVGRRVRVVDRAEEATLDRVLDVRGDDLALDRRREAHAGAQLAR